MKRVTLPCEISFMKVSSYVGTGTTGRVDELIGLTGTVKDRHVIIIEDIVDTGITIDKVIKLLSIQEPASIEVCATLFKKEAYRGIHPPKYYGFEIPNKFVVGYGLDYDQHGRNLSAIYQVKS
jgi:hypoxanthine phosphoribosyltransferase